MDSKVLFSIGKIVQVALRGETEKVNAYAEQLIQQLEQCGEAKAADRLRRTLDGTPANPATASRSGLAEIVPIPIPVDSESRLPVADIDTVRDDVFVVLNGESGDLLDRFLGYCRNADRLADRGVAITPSMLVYGPPGCGKTLLARRVAKELDLPLLTARVDSLISSYLGSTAKNIRALFDHAESRPCVLFLDEIDSIAKMRDDNHELGELKRVVISLLQNIDRLSSDHVVIAATNHPHLLDAAVWRRFSYKLAMDLPDEDSRTTLLTSFFRNMIDGDAVSVLCALTSGMSGAQIRTIADESIRSTILDSAEADSVSLATAVGVTLEQIAHKPVTNLEEKMEIVARVCGDTLSTRAVAKMLGESQSKVWRVRKMMESADGGEADHQDRCAG